MSETPRGEDVVNVEDIDKANLRDRLHKDPDEQRNREELPDPEDRDTGADHT